MQQWHCWSSGRGLRCVDNWWWLSWSLLVCPLIAEWFLPYGSLGLCFLDGRTRLHFQFQLHLLQGQLYEEPTTTYVPCMHSCFTVCTLTALLLRRLLGPRVLVPRVREQLLLKSWSRK